MYRRPMNVARLRQLLDYDPITGVLTWKKRDPVLPRDKRLNKMYAGKIAGCYRKDYLVVSIDGEDLLAHRVIWAIVTGEAPTDEIDHINGDKHDNRWANLRAASHGQNGINRPKGKNNTSGFKGVSWRKDSNKWRVVLRVNGKFFSGGHHIDIADAVTAYRQYAIEYYGEFAYLD